MTLHQQTKITTLGSKISTTKKIFSYPVLILFFTLPLFQTGCSKPDAEKATPTASHKKAVTSHKDQAKTPGDTEPIAADSGSQSQDAKKPEINSGDKKDITAFIEQWKIAWQKSPGSAGDINNYFSFYDESFSSKSLNFSQWQKSKKIKNQGKSWIEIWLSDLQITAIADNEYSVTFSQEYSSSNYSDKGKKQLTVVKKDSGWKITSEETIQ